MVLTTVIIQQCRYDLKFFGFRLHSPIFIGYDSGSLMVFIPFWNFFGFTIASLLLGRTVCLTSVRWIRASGMFAPTTLQSQYEFGVPSQAREL